MGIDIRNLKKVYAISPTMVPADEPICVEISYFDQTEVDGKDGAYLRNELYLKGWKLPLRLNNKAIDALEAALGTWDTDEMQNKKILIQTQMDTIYGESKLVVKILPAKARAAMPAVTQAQACPALPPPSSKPVAAALASMNKAARNPTPIGAAIAEKTLAKLKENKSNFDKCLEWLKMNDREAHDAMVGKEVAEIPAWTLHSIKYYLDALTTPAELVGQPKHDPESDAPPPQEIDVPF